MTVGYNGILWDMKLIKKIYIIPHPMILDTFYIFWVPIHIILNIYTQYEMP